MFSSKIPTYLLAATILTAYSCGNASQPAPQGPPPAINVTVDTATLEEAVYHDDYPATVVPLNQIELRPQVTGFITGVHFEDGARVRKGQLLYSIDQQLYSANYEQAVANLKLQEANLLKAQKDADRYHELAKNDAVAKQLVDNADAALEVAKSQVAASKAAIQGVGTSVRYTKVYAPFDGLIGISQVKVGTAVTAGQTVLNTVSTDNPLAVDVNIDQREIFRFTNMMQKPANAGDSTFTLSFGNDVYNQPGKLVLIDRAVNAQTGTIKVRLSFPNSNNLLRAGMNATVKVKNNASTKQLLIPYKAVTEQLGEFFVYILGENNVVNQRRVTLGRQIGNKVIVTEGLSEGNIVAVEGVQNLREGATVNIAGAPTSIAPQK